MYGDVYLEKGIVKRIGYIPKYVLDTAENLTVVDAQGGWVTPGLGESTQPSAQTSQKPSLTAEDAIPPNPVDLHSHLGVFSTPWMRGAYDMNSPNGPVLPWLRSIDAFNTHDESFELAIAGGVTSVQVLPGSGNAIGGQAFMMKLRKTSERSPTSMLIEPPYLLNESDPSPNLPFRWRHLKCVSFGYD